MSQSRNATKAGLTALALLVCLGTKADAAQCGSTAAGYDTWKRQFAEQARGKHQRLQSRSLDRDELCDCHHCRRPRPEKL